MNSIRPTLNQLGVLWALRWGAVVVLQSFGQYTGSGLVLCCGKAGVELNMLQQISTQYAAMSCLLMTNNRLECPN